MSFPNLRSHRFLSTKPLYHLLRPLITYPNLPSLLQNHSLLHYLLLSLTTRSPKACSLMPNTWGSRTYPRRGLANWLHSRASKMKTKTHAHSSRHFFRVDWGFSYEIRNCLRGDSFSYKKSSLALASHSLCNPIISQLLSPKSFNK